MSRPFTIRPAGSADEQALADLDRRTWSTTHAVAPPPQEPHGPFFDSAHRPAHFLVAEFARDGEPAVEAGLGEGALVGYIRLVAPTPLPSNAHVRQIQGLVVDPRVRGRGIARALLEAGCARAREQGAVRVTLRVLGHNTVARRLYAAAGFVEEGVLRGEFLLDGAYVDDVLMGRSLTG
ncbi:GNAT family N-acetyltransferase [Streptomyces sp. JJ36]|uniref:GNAT family N-acetyltransferase n=1 Tax=Streptomyces sp. JJ36 TaxID=2736645 RepID=UPI001F3D8E8F|nr:GNAT family N-acetyltransferase [Streptomyces sp. JJ36]MCF6525819.1 GNAT family N-acetyltransferase [Streptomyces sp. JJ36]